MPFRSQAQRKYLFAVAERGDVPKDMPHQWAKETEDMSKLPERKISNSSMAKKRLSGK